MAAKRQRIGMRRWGGAILSVGVLGAVRLAAVLGTAVPGHSAPEARTPESPTHWVATWASAQQIPEPRNALPSRELTDVTLRQIVHLSLGGRSLRIRFSNA